MCNTSTWSSTAVLQPLLLLRSPQPFFVNEHGRSWTNFHKIWTRAWTKYFKRISRLLQRRRTLAKRSHMVIKCEMISNKIRFITLLNEVYMQQGLCTKWTPRYVSFGFRQLVIETATCSGSSNLFIKETLFRKKNKTKQNFENFLKYLLPSSQAKAQGNKLIIKELVLPIKIYTKDLITAIANSQEELQRVACLLGIIFLDNWHVFLIAVTAQPAELGTPEALLNPLDHRVAFQ